MVQNLAAWTVQGICADRSYIAQNLYDDVAAQGCNVFLAPSAGAGNTTDWVTMHS